MAYKFSFDSASNGKSDEVSFKVVSFKVDESVVQI